MRVSRIRMRMSGISKLFLKNEFRKTKTQTNCVDWTRSMYGNVWIIIQSVCQSACYAYITNCSFWYMDWVRLCVVLHSFASHRHTHTHTHTQYAILEKIHTKCKFNFPFTFAFAWNWKITELEWEWVRYGIVWCECGEWRRWCLHTFAYMYTITVCVPNENRNGTPNWNGNSGTFLYLGKCVMDRWIEIIACVSLLCRK